MSWPWKSFDPNNPKTTEKSMDLFVTLVTAGLTVYLLFTVIKPEKF